MSKQSPATRRYLERIDGDFLFCLRETWRLLNLGEPALVQYDIAKWLSRGEAQSKGVKAFRGVAKTWITLVYMLWSLRLNPNERILLVSESQGVSEKSLYLLRRWIDLIPWFRHLAPNPEREHRDAATRLDVGPSDWDRVPSVTAIGITGQLASNRASKIVGDDIEVLENSLTQEQRARTRERVTEFESILFPGGEIIFLGTPHCEESIYDYLPTVGYKFRTWPALYPRGENINYVSPLLLKHMRDGTAQPGDAVWPERFSRELLEDREVKQKTKFLQQYMMVSDLGREDRYPLKLRNFITMPVQRDKAPITIAWGTSNDRGSTAINDIQSVGFGSDCYYGPIWMDQTWESYSGTKGYIDPAGTGNRDELAWAIGGELYGNIFVKSVGGVHGGASQENLERIVRDLRRNDCRDLCIETNFGGDMLIQLIKPIIQRFSIAPGKRDDEGRMHPEGWHCNVEGDHATKKKEQRICDDLESPMNQHRIVLDVEVAKDQAFAYQLTRMNRDNSLSDHDDRVDAFSGMVRRWTTQLDQDQHSQAARKRQENYEEMLRKYQAAFQPARRPNWIGAQLPH